MPTSSPWPLHTERLSLRPYAPEDLEWMASVYGRPDVARFLLEDPWTSDEAKTQLLKRMARNDLGGPSGALSLVVDHGGQPIGNVSIWFTDPGRRVAEIGWVLNPRHHGQGFGREAVRAVLRFAFKEYGLHRVIAQMDARNQSSARLASALGMQQEAHHRQDFWSKGEWTDTLVFALLSTDQH